MAYRNLRGSLSTPRRLEQSIARVCELICSAAGLKKDELNTPFVVADFMPHEDGFRGAESELTLDEFFRKAVASGDE